MSAEDEKGKGKRARKRTHSLKPPQPVISIDPFMGWRPCDLITSERFHFLMLLH